MTIRVPAWDTPITINRYVVQHGDDAASVSTGIKATAA